ncbi:hypothetical protein GCM10010468_56670 [Actinocorallia longicatena]|uniref:non-specific serine/threonine protein kinase n=1 Tax=Actinocorallia longicatena TaxID=111803 RepID=A0ABP6QH14_9ACTN
MSGRYRLVQALDPAQTLWRARDEVLHRDVTVRQIEDSALDAVRAATVLRHPGLVIVHDVVEQDGRSWVVTELTEGPSLATSGLMDEPQAVAVGLALLDALVSAHALGVVHGGIQPDGVVFTADGQVKLTGFGITRPHEAYTPPEAVTVPASDLWALAATLYTAVEGRVPFADLGALRNGQVTPSLRGRRLGAVLAPLLGPDPAARPDSDLVRRGLRDLLPASRDGRLRLNRIAVALGAAAIVAVVVPAAVFASLPGEPKKTPAALPAANGGPAPGPVVPPRSKEFVSMPDACSLLTDAQAETLVPRHDKPSSYQPGTCNWRSKVSLRPDLPGSLSFDLTIRIELGGGEDAFDQAKRFGGLGGGPVSDLAGLGNEAFLGSGLRGTSVVYRLANVVVTVEYARRGDPNPKMRPVAERGARWSAEALNRV